MSLRGGEFQISYFRWVDVLVYDRLLRVQQVCGDQERGVGQQLFVVHDGFGRAVRNDPVVDFEIVLHLFVHREGYVQGREFDPVSRNGQLGKGGRRGEFHVGQDDSRYGGPLAIEAGFGKMIDGEQEIVGLQEIPLLDAFVFVHVGEKAGLLRFWCRFFVRNRAEMECDVIQVIHLFERNDLFL